LDSTGLTLTAPTEYAHAATCDTTDAEGAVHMSWSWKLARIAGIDVYIHVTFLMLIAWIAVIHWSGRSGGTCRERHDRAAAVRLVAGG